MDLALTETQEMLRNAAQAFMEAEVPKARVLEIDSSDTGFAPDLWQKICEQGWPGAVIPEEYGGLGLSFTDLGVIYEVMGYFACPSPHLSSSVLSAHTILEAGDEAQKQALLPAIASGEQIFALAVTEADYGWSPSAIQMAATGSNGSYVLNGTKLFIPDAHVADQIIVAARTSKQENGISLFLVDKNASGLSIRTMSGWLGEKLNELTFKDVAGSLLGTADAAWPALERAMDRAIAVLNLYMAGGSQKVYDLCRDYSQTRIAFGSPIGTFQRVQDHVIEAVIQADAGKWTAYEALWKLDEGHDDASLAISTAKAVASVGFADACDHSHNVHGGIGTDMEFGLTQYTARARTLQHYLGDAIHHKKRAARLLNL
jgi:alkylation response protein AidB-like acyl-CoA dehydrogenase